MSRDMDAGNPRGPAAVSPTPSSIANPSRRARHHTPSANPVHPSTNNVTPRPSLPAPPPTPPPRRRRAPVDAGDPRPGERILDVATGTGMVAAELLRRCECSVVGIDQSAEMLAEARRRFAAEPGSRIELRLGEAEALPFADGGFDALT